MYLRQISNVISYKAFAIEEIIFLIKIIFVLFIYLFFFPLSLVLPHFMMTFWLVDVMLKRSATFKIFSQQIIGG